MACYLARAGVRCAVFERDVFPRPHVGESLVPSSTRVFAELGLVAKLEEHRFPRKYGAVWTSHASSRIFDVDWQGLGADTYADIRFDERDQEGVDRNYTWHVDRGKFDLMLLKHAQESGADVHQGVRVAAVDFADPRHVVLRCQLGRQEVGVRARMVVDASGRQTLLGIQEKLKRRDPVFDQYALHAWFDGYDRRVAGKGDEQADYIYIHFLPLTNAWVWQIPITDAVTSIGVVTQKKNFARSRASREQYFWDCLATRPEIHKALLRARQVRPFKEEGDYSYAMEQVCGDRFMMIGDAARFVDPIFSTGVSIALNSARFASRDVLAAVQKDDFRKESFATFEATIRRGTKNWHDFIGLYYRLNVLFTAFILDKRYRLDVLKLLQGDVYDEDQPAVLRKMREVVTKVEQNERHPWHALLNDLTQDAFQPTF
jgi:FADH2 O2-dependent halogenase